MTKQVKVSGKESKEWRAEQSVEKLKDNYGALTIRLHSRN